MERTPYFATLSGRIFLATAGFATLCAGLIALPGARPFAFLITIVACLAAIVGCLWSVGLIDDRHSGAAIALLVGLPLVGGAYFAGLQVVAGRSAGVGIAFILIAVALFALAAWETRRASSMVHAPLSAPR